MNKLQQQQQQQPEYASARVVHISAISGLRRLRWGENACCPILSALYSPFRGVTGSGACSAALEVKVKRTKDDAVEEPLETFLVLDNLPYNLQLGNPSLVSGAGCANGRAWGVWCWMKC